MKSGFRTIMALMVMAALLTVLVVMGDDGRQVEPAITWSVK